MALLFIDLLGTRSRWHRDGREGVERVFANFRDGILRCLLRVGPQRAIAGGIESDSAAIVCDSGEAAISLAQEVYQDFFGGNALQNRAWIRGVIVARPPDGDALRGAERFPAPFGNLQNITYSGCLLDAISVERSGFKGMRVVVASNLVTEEEKLRRAVKIGPQNFIPFKKLEHAGYPARIGEEFVDFLWMATGDDADWDGRMIQMATRLRYAASDSEEFLQAAATQVVFNECAAIRKSLANRGRA